jgi:hypothetical protein
MDAAKRTKLATAQDSLLDLLQIELNRSVASRDGKYANLSTLVDKLNVLSHLEQVEEMNRRLEDDLDADTPAYSLKPTNLVTVSLS